ncbi:MAG: succinate dehydrogenase, cytochrome b556 subunit [Cycloclasticus sp. symbiont of Poecilosclerida sp. M]|nr:MAG: succinate dehydrogenase, cytochrome b556 subunit [Cycloclasticus sp. symbiont of Poecilosclerida sp. M]
MNTSNRPLSPHLDVYKLPLSALLSIVHRGTGAFLSIGTVALVWWLMSLAGGEESYIVAQKFFSSFMGSLILFGWTFALFFHLANGIRHLVWDCGYGFEKTAVDKSSWVVIGTAGFLTFCIWFFAYVFTIGA